MIEELLAYAHTSVHYDRGSVDKHRVSIYESRPHTHTHTQKLGDDKDNLSDIPIL